MDPLTGTDEEALPKRIRFFQPESRANAAGYVAVVASRMTRVGEYRRGLRDRAED